MKVIGFVVVCCGVFVAAAVNWRRQWVYRAGLRIDAEIAANRYRTRPGMHAMDEALRDRSARRRRERKEAIENATRELERPKLQRVS